MELSTDKLRFMAGISHEIRNPLNAIIGISHLLKKENSKEEQEELIDSLLHSSENLLELTNNILDFSKLESGELRYTYTAVDIKKALPKALFGQQALARAKGLELSIEIEEAVPQALLLDRVKFLQIMINLVSNAIKFTEKGKVRVYLQVEEVLENAIRLKCGVSDTGIGVPKEKLKLIFKPFCQASGKVNLKYGGTGLGLSISSYLIKSMGGELKVKSELNRGSEFSFNITAEIAEGMEPEIPQLQDRPVKLPTDLKVLIVDDNKINLLITGKQLKNWGIAFKTASDGREALAKVQEEDFGLVLMDLLMPCMDGFEAISAIRKLGEKYLALPILALSGSSEENLQEEIAAAGFTDLLSKPFQPRQLIEKISSAVMVK